MAHGSGFLSSQIITIAMLVVLNLVPLSLGEVNKITVGSSIELSSDRF